VASYSFTDKRGQKVNTSDFVKVASAPKDMKPYLNTRAMVMSPSLGGIVMLASEVPDKVPGRIFYMKEQHLEFDSTS
jgi:hypothetical protein